MSRLLTLGSLFSLIAGLPGFILVAAGPVLATSVSLTVDAQIPTGDVWVSRFAFEGDYVAWESCDGGEGEFDCAGDWEIYLWSGSTVVRLTDNDVNDEAPSVNRSGTVVWQACDGTAIKHELFGETGCIGDIEIYVYDGSSTTPLTDNAVDDRRPTISDSGAVAYQTHDGNDYEIAYLADLAPPYTPQFLTSNSFRDYSPRMSDERIAWLACDGGDIDSFDCIGDPEIYTWNGSSAVPVTSDEDYQSDLRVGGASVVWSQSPSAIYVWGGQGTPTLVSTQGCVDDCFDVSQGRVVWTGYDSESGSDEIFYWENGVATQLNAEVSNLVDVQIDGSRLAWKDEEALFTGTLTGVPEPGATALAAAALFSLGGLRRKQIRTD